MFEIEKMNNEFDYSLVDNKTADFLRSCEYEMNGIAEDARVKFGGVLKKAQGELSNHHKGIFQKWIVSGGISLDDAYYYIKLNESSRNLNNTQKDNFLKAPKSLQKETMKKDTPKELQEKVLSGDIKTHKEYKQLESKLKQEQQFREQAEQQVKQLENREPEVVEKEVIPREMEMELTTTKSTLKLAREELEQLKKDREFYELHKDNFDEEQAEKQRKKLEWESEKNVLEMKVYVDRFLENVAITAFRKGAIASANQSKKNKLQQSVDELKEFTRQMDSVLSGRIEIN